MHWNSKTTIHSLGRSALLLTITIPLISCAISKPMRDHSTENNRTEIVRNDVREAIDGAFGTPPQSEESNAAKTIPSSSTVIPSLSTQDGVADIDGTQTAPEFGVTTVDAVVPPLPLPNFIDLVFGQMLSTPYVTGPGVAANTDIVQLRSSGTMSARVFFDLVTTALKDYGVRVVPDEGVFQIVEDSALKSRIPRFVRSRARASTPSGLRPVVQFVELNAISAEDMSTILRQAFGSRNENLRMEPDRDSNYVILSGLPEEVNAALSIIFEMDELQYAGTQVQRYTPVYWSVRTLSRELSRILSAEGWQTSETETAPKPVLLLSVEYSNDLLIFSRTTKARARVNYWISQLDRPAKEGTSDQLFVYNVRNLDAVGLSNTVNQVLSASPSQAGGGYSGTAPVGANQTTGQQGAGNGPGPGGLVVDPYGNRLIFSGSASEYERIQPLLESLDQPTPEVMIEVMIAQITLTDTIRNGVEWSVQRLGGDLLGSVSSTGLGLGGGGLDFSIFPGNANVKLNAFAENKQVDILSTPRLVARSGSSAQVQVGTEVPILSSQRLPTGSFGGGSNLDVISSVEYRATGIILQIEPIVFSNNRIDLNITQEVSATLPSGGPVQSPSFSNTNVTTHLSLEDGSTAVIGGLIQDNVSRSERGIPFLKDIPFIGQAFSVHDTAIDRTELVLLITAYVLRGQDDKRFLAEKFSRDIDKTLNADNTVTLRPRKF